MATPATYKVFIDWSDDGDYSDTGEDVTGRTLDGRTPLTMQYGRDQNRALSPIGPGEAHFALDNASRDYSPENTSSPLNGLVLPGRPVLLQAQALSFATDTFTRTVGAGGWGTATSGQAYTIATGTASNFSVSSNVGRISLSAVSADHIITLPVAEPNATLSATFTVPAVATGNFINAYLIGRRINSNNQYAVRVAFGTTGVISLSIERLLAGVVTTPYALTSTGITYSGSTAYSVKFQLDGTMLRAKVWATAGSEPSAWMAEVSDTGISAETAAASVIGVRAILSSSNTNSLPVLVTVDDLSAGFPATALFNGYLDDFKLNPDAVERWIDVDCIDALGTLRGVKVTTGLYQALRPGEAIGVLLDAVGWPAALRDLDTGTTVMPYWWLDGDDAFDALMQLVYNEGPPALVTVDTTGRLVFRGRHHRLLNTVSITSQSTWRSLTPSPAISPPAVYNHGWKEIINSISFQVPVRAFDPELTAVWSAGSSVNVADGDTALIAASGTSPFYGAVTPVEDVDYTLVSGAVTIVLSATSGAATTVQITASGGPAQLDGLQVRAYALNTTSTRLVQAEDAGSVAKYGRRSLPDERSPDFASMGDAQAIAQIILGQRAERLPTISVTIGPAGENAELTQQLGRDLSDRVHVIEPHTGLDADCYIEQISHSVTEGGLAHSTGFGLEKVAEQAALVFILGSATSGVLGTNKLGRRGLMDPTSIFILGSATNGVLGTDVLAA